MSSYLTRTWELHDAMLKAALAKDSWGEPGHTRQEDPRNSTNPSPAAWAGAGFTMFCKILLASACHGPAETKLGSKCRPEHSSECTSCTPTFPGLAHSGLPSSPSFLWPRTGQAWPLPQTDSCSRAAEAVTPSRGCREPQHRLWGWQGGAASVWGCLQGIPALYPSTHTAARIPR